MAEAQSTERSGWGAAGAWIFYDFAYSLFAFVLFARYLNTWIINDLNHPDIYYSGTQVVTALSLVLLMPLAGSAADRMGRHLPLLVGFSLAAAGAAAALGTLPSDVHVLVILALGGLCAAATGLAFAQFDPLLAVVAPQRRWGTVSGLAVASGYLGIVVALPIWGEWIVGEGSKQAAFAPAGAALVLGLLPLIFLVREAGVRPDSPRARRPFRQLRDSISTARRVPGVARLLCARFLYADAIGTLNIYMVVYISRLGTFSERDKNVLIGAGVLCAGVGAVASGYLASRVGPRRVLLTVLPLLAVALIIAAAFGQPWTVWLMAPSVGIGLGTVYAADRVFMLRLTPDEYRGELFGVFNLIGRAAQALGPFLLWASVIWILHSKTNWLNVLDASRVSVGLLALSVMIGASILAPLSDHGHTRPRP